MRIGIIFLVLLCACAAPIRRVPFEIVASAPAAIDVNGINVCDTTPCTVELQCKSDSSWNEQDYLSRVAIEATPVSGGRVHHQRKTISACQVEPGKSGTVRFEMGLSTAPSKAEITIKTKSTAAPNVD